MTRDQFWDLIDRGRANVHGARHLPQWLENELGGMPSIEIFDFDAWLGTFLGNADDELLWIAGG